MGNGGKSADEEGVSVGDFCRQQDRTGTRENCGETAGGRSCG